MRNVKLTKIEDTQFNNDHPNNINKGYTKIGLELDKPEIGKIYQLENRTWFKTSLVTEIIDDTTFKTENSIYKIEIIDKLTLDEYLK